MTVRECYMAMESDYDEILSRLGNDERIQKFLAKFLNEKSYVLLCSSLEEKNMEEAFRAAHTLKGISQNLSFAPLINSVGLLVEKLRNRTEYGEDIEPLFALVKADYEKISAGIRSLLEE